MGSRNDFYKTKLMDCAAAIGGGNLILADLLLKEIKSLISAETNQGRKKLVNYYTEALVRRVYGIHPPYPLPFLPPSYFYDFYAYIFAPFDYFAYLTTKNAIKNAFTGKKRVHVINFSVVENPSQWYWLMKDLSTRQPGTGGVSSLRLTSIVPKLSIHFEDFLQEIRQELTKDAEEVQIDFRLRQLVANYKSEDDIECCMSKLRRTSQDEMLVVRWCFSLHSLLSQEGVLEKVLLKMKDLKPDVMVIVEQEANHNSPDFLNRLGESFQYYSSVFESLDKDRFTDKKELWERYFGRQIGNVVSSEGIRRVERHESLALWRQRLTRAGFLPVRQQLYKLKNDWEKNGFYPGYRIEEKDGHALFCRKNCPLAVTSIWKPSALTQFKPGQDVAEFPPFPPIENLDKAISSDSDDDKADDPSIVTGRNLWSMGDLSMNQIAASAKIFDISEYVCHKYELPLALTWICDRRVDNTISKGKSLLYIEETACYVEDLSMRFFMKSYVNGSHEEGQGVADKALCSGRCFVPDIFMLGAVDDPFIKEAELQKLHAAIAIRLTSIHTCKDYVLEFFLPRGMKQSSEQEFLVERLLSTLKKKCRNMWIVGDRELNAANISEVRFEHVTTSNSPQAAASERSQPALSNVVLSSSELVAMVTFNQIGDGVETHKSLEQNVRERNATVEPSLNDGNDNDPIGAEHNLSSNKRQRNSRVWIQNGEVWETFKGCNREYRAESTRGTSNLHKHLKECPAKGQENAEHFLSLVETDAGDLNEPEELQEPLRKKKQTETSGAKSKPQQSELPSENEAFLSQRSELRREEENFLEQVLTEPTQNKTKTPTAISDNEANKQGRMVPILPSSLVHQEVGRVLMSSVFHGQGITELQTEPDSNVSPLMYDATQTFEFEPTIQDMKANFCSPQSTFQLTEISTERMGDYLQQKLSDMAKPVESPTTWNEDIDTVEPSNSIGVAGQSEVDIQVVESMIKASLASGVEILKFPGEVAKIRQACEFLTSSQLAGMMTMQRKGSIYCLKSELDNLIFKLHEANMAVEKDSELKSRQGRCQCVATEKLKEIDQIQENRRSTRQKLNEAKETLAILERQMAEVKMTISNQENKLQILNSHFTQLATETHDLEVTTKNVVEERKGLSIQLHKAKKDQRYVEEQWRSIQSLFGE